MLKSKDIVRYNAAMKIDQAWEECRKKMPWVPVKREKHE